MGQNTSKYVGTGILAVAVVASTVYLLTPNAAKEELKEELAIATQETATEPPKKKEYKYGQVILNDGTPNENSVNEDVVQLSRKFSKMLLRLKGKFMDDEGNSVDYSSMKKSSLFEDYCKLVSDLKLIDLGALNHNEKVAFLINIYNALCIHGSIIKGAPKSKPERQDFFPNVCYYIGDNVYSLDDVEHGLLRGNKINGKTGKPFFDENDPRFQKVCEPDCRVHFALVCGAQSCPPIRYYKSDTLDRDLDSAAQTFIQSEVTVSRKGEVTANRILMWYSQDFAPTDQEMLKKISQWMTPSTRSLYESLTNQPKIVWKEYDWGLNGF